MTADLCKTVAEACRSALATSDVDGRENAKRRAAAALQRLRGLSVPKSRHRRLAEQCFDLTAQATGPQRRFHAGSLAEEHEDGDAEERQVELEVVQDSLLARARSAIQKALEVT